MAKAKPSAPAVDVTALIQEATATISDSVGLLNERLSVLESKVDHLAPKDSLVPREVWAALGHEAVIASSIKGAIEGGLSNAPLHNLNRGDTQEVYAKMAFELAERILIFYGERLNQVAKKENTDEDSGQS